MIIALLLMTTTSSAVNYVANKQAEIVPAVPVVAEAGSVDVDLECVRNLRRDGLFLGEVAQMFWQIVKGGRARRIVGGGNAQHHVRYQRQGQSRTQSLRREYVKGDDYGSLTGKDSADYKKAQVAVKAIKTYPAQLVETQDLSKVDAISGATISFGQFVGTVKRAVAEASE